MTFTMSSEGDSAKSAMLEPGDEKSSAEQTTDSSQDATDAKVERPSENHEEKNAKGGSPEQGTDAVEPEQQDEKKKEKAKDEPKEPETKPKSDNDDDSGASKEENVSEKKEDDKPAKDKPEGSAEVKNEKGEQGGKDEDDKGEKEVPLLDQPLEQKGKRERKNVQRFNEEFTEHKDNVKVDIVPGSGTALGDIPRVDASISRFKNDDLKLLHRLLFKSVGKTMLIKKNIRKFSGFDFKKDSEEYTKKVNAAHKLEVKNLKSICEMLDLQKSGTKDEIINRVIDFLMEPKDSGRQVDGGRPKRTAAVRANNRGYSSHDDYSSDDRAASRARRDKGMKQNTRKRSNLKDDSSSDEDFQPNQSDASDDRSHSTKRKRRSQRKKSSDEESEASVATSDESDDEPKSKRKRSPAKANNRSKPKGTGRRGRPPASTKRTPTRPKKKAPSTDEESDKKDEGSSSEDEPLVKKAKSSQPPTDDEIKTFIKSILEGANLEEITMKTVCQRVYSNYPDFDLTHKKYFIKSTVKSLIST